MPANLLCHGPGERGRKEAGGNVGLRAANRRRAKFGELGRLERLGDRLREGSRQLDLRVDEAFVALAGQRP